VRSFVCERNVQNFPIHVIRALYIDVSSYLTLTIQPSSRLKRSANHLWNNSDVCRKKFGEWSLLQLINDDIIDDTDTVTSRPFRKSFKCRYYPRMDYAFCFLTLKSSEKWRSPLFWCYMQLQWPNSTRRYIIFNIHYMSFIYCHLNFHATKLVKTMACSFNHMSNFA
jgi:hypothetical protein